MDYLSVIAISIGLSVDSFSVSFADGLAFPRMKAKRKIFVSIAFALIQFLFITLGWLVGGQIIFYVQKIDHWLSFILLSIVSVKMILEAKEESDIKCLNLGNIILQGIATSIDAMIVGFGMATIWSTIIPQATVVGIVTFVFALSGFGLGKIIGNKLVQVAPYLGAIILFSIGIKILIEHLLG